MKIKFLLAAFLVASALSLGSMANAGSGGKDTGKDSPAATASAEQSAQNETMHVEGEKRFRSNCGRCHAAPPKFPPRMMATIVRHMRVRATITDQDMRLILRYMTE
ncbi:MAG TPA: cytochrome c [Candidatus Angelobacter sp.]|nr:cytochrome c [Candidatus Angelobacter sp.]